MTWRKGLAGTFLLLILIAAGAVVYLWTIPLPKAQPLLQATVVYGANGKVLATFSEQNRVSVGLAQVPPVVVNAVVSTEDRHFFTEGGVNPTSMVRALLADVTGHGGLQGGSTITQQYVKQTYLSPKRSLIRKIKEAAIAIRISRKESKPEILQNYLNTIYWGRGAYGVEAASRAYFGKDVGHLGLPEASLLAGLIREPELADPAHDPKLARLNQRDTLKAMVRDRKITKAEAAAAAAVPFSQYVIAPSTTSGAAAGGSGDDYFISAVHQELYAKYGRAVVDAGGLRVTTALDPTLQSEAYRSVYGSGPGALNPLAGDPSGALVSLDDNGAVKAMVGGKDYTKLSVNLALGTAGGGSGRQAGSTFKAFMLAEVIREGYSVQSVFPAPPTFTIPHGNANGQPWVVTNYEHEAVNPQMSLIDATALSVNTVYAQVVARIGADKLDSMAKALGINPAELPQAYPSQVLGTADVSPLEMTAAYAALADGGVYHLPILVTKVTKADGTPLPLPISPRSRRVLSPEQAALETYVLQQVVQRGTGVTAGGIGTPVAGKTGTTEHSVDAWFIGYTPKITTSVWMGYADGARSMDGFRGLSSVTGGTIPAQFWHHYMAAALSSFPELGGGFAPVTSFGGKMLTPSTPSTATTSSSPTTSSSTSTTSTTIGPSTTLPASVTTLPAVAPPTTAAKRSKSPPTTAPSTTTTSTTVPPPSTTVAGPGG